MAKHTHSDPDPAPSAKVETHEDTLPSNIPKVEEAVRPGGSPAPDIKEYKGKFIGHAGVVAGGQEFAVAYKPDPLNNRDYSAQNSKHFWQGNREEFRKNFRMANGDEITDKNDPGTDNKGEPKPDSDEK